MTFARPARLAAALIAWYLTAAVHAQPEPPPDVQALAARWTQAYEARDRAALGSLYASDARLMIHGEPTIAGRAAIEDYWARDFADRDPSTVLTVTHSVAGADYRLVHGDYRVTSRADGRSLAAGRFAHLWTREAGGQWRLDRDLWSDSFDPYDPRTTDRASREVQALAARWTRAFNEHDRRALTALYADDARLMMQGAPALVGRTDIGDYWAGDLRERRPLTSLVVTHAVVGIDMTLVHGNYYVIDRRDGAMLSLGRFAHIWTRAPGGDWRLDRDLWQERPGGR
jgi:uncharacterized protein (TIGR02246 family)